MEIIEQFFLFMDTKKSRGEIIEFFIENYKIKKSIMNVAFAFLVAMKILVKINIVFYVVNPEIVEFFKGK